MLSKDLLTRWNRAAIAHAKENDVRALERAKHAPRGRGLDPTDPRCLTYKPSWNTAVPSGAAGKALRDTYGTVQAVIADTPAPPTLLSQVLDGMSPWQGVKYRGQQVDHPNITGMAEAGSNSGGVGIATGDGDDADGSAATGTTGGANNDYLVTSCTHISLGFIHAGRFTLYAKIKLPDLTNRRDWLGAVNTGIQAVAGTDSPAFNCVTIRFSSGTGNWEIYTYDGAAGSIVTVKAGVAGVVEMLLMSDSARAYGRVLDAGGDSGWVTKTTNLPALGTELSNYGMLFQAKAAVVKTCRWYTIQGKFR